LCGRELAGMKAQKERGVRPKKRSVFAKRKSGGHSGEGGGEFPGEKKAGGIGKRRDLSAELPLVRQKGNPALAGFGRDVRRGKKEGT